ncbi:MAG: tetratricopeptide repeat protein, partial [Roseimicrobium sp.]
MPLAAQNLDLERVFDQRQIQPVRALLAGGDYANVARLCELFIERGQPSPEWWEMRLQAYVALGRVEEIVTATTEAAKRHQGELPMLMACHDALVAYGKSEAASIILKQVNVAAKALPAGQRTARDMVALGRAALAAGAEPQKVIAQFFEPAKKKEPALVEAYLALGELALAKADYARAANEFRDGLKQRSDDPELCYGLARAFQSSDRQKSLELIGKVLETNPNHEGALLLRAEHYLAAEEYDAAALSLESVLDVQPHHPEAWAVRAVLNILADNKPEFATESRNKALKLWPQNPAPDTLIGRCLSRAYRFREASEHLEAALQLDASHLPAKLHLCHALFRLGREDEAWKLAQQIREADAYNIQAYNIGLLEAEMKGFTVREEPDFVMKMPARDAAIYGDRALQLLREAKQVLCAKYGLVLDHPVLVEFFPTQQDFAIRTFGNLGGQGILGACFGTVVTMNSPGSLASNRSNWEATLWHEFCHVVTLSVTKNRMPRWLSEGISVHEEAQRNPAWGMRMNADYRRFTLDDETLTPLSKMSGAFLSPENSAHLMFAYYESAQAVDWLSRKFGAKKFQAILADLAEGRRINEALERHMEAVRKLDEDFAKHMQSLAKAFAPKGDWTKPEPGELDPRNDAAVAEFLRKRPNSLWALEQRTQRLLAGEQWKEALALAQRLVTLTPENAGHASGYALAARAYRGLKQPADEAEMLRHWASRDGSAEEALLRLLELEVASQNWQSARDHARGMMAIHPFLKQPYEALAQACESLADEDGAVWSLRK